MMHFWAKFPIRQGGEKASYYIGCLQLAIKVKFYDLVQFVSLSLQAGTYGPKLKEVIQAYVAYITFGYGGYTYGLRSNQWKKPPKQRSTVLAVFRLIEIDSQKLLGDKKLRQTNF